jgi:hypothetical protein
MQQKHKQPPAGANLDEVKFRNGVWVIVEKSSTERYGFCHGPYPLKRVANEWARKGGAKEVACA